MHRFSTTTRSASPSASRTSLSSAPSETTSDSPSETSSEIGRVGELEDMARPGTSRSTGPSPATVTTSYPSVRSTSAQPAATIETPSVPPRRNETMAQVGMVVVTWVGA